MFVVCCIKNLTWVCIQIIKSDHKICTLSTDHTMSSLLYLFCPLSCCILLSFLFVALPPSLPYVLYWPQGSHPSWPLLHSDTKSDGRRVSEGSCCQVVFEKQAASFFPVQEKRDIVCLCPKKLVKMQVFDLYYSCVVVFQFHFSLKRIQKLDFPTLTFSNIGS